MTPIRRAGVAAAKARRVLTPVDVTQRFPSFRTGGPENWKAVSRDGAWVYRRLEISGTPWEVEHASSGTEAGWYGSLPDARAATADGSALAHAERIQAHLRGEHETERNTSCVKC